jgi:hypothetical protein
MVPVVLLTLGVGGVVLLGSIAANDPGFALERDYYQRAVHWDRQQDEWAENRRLGYRLAAEIRRGASGVEVVARVLDGAGAPLGGAHVEMEAFANARAAARRTLTLVEAAPGAYHAPLGAARPGLWELRFTVVRGSDRFTEVVRVDVQGSAP